MSNAINYIGIARKAGELVVGEVNSGTAIRSGRVKLLILASDASANARSRAENYVYGTKVPLALVPIKKLEISDMVGVNGCSMAAFTDIGLASAFMDSLAGEDVQFSETAKLLAELKEKAIRRKHETQAKESNKEIGKPSHSEMRRK